MGSDPARRRPRDRSGALAPPTGRHSQMRSRRGRSSSLCLASEFWGRICRCLAVPETGQVSLGCWLSQQGRILASTTLQLSSARLETGNQVLSVRKKDKKEKLFHRNVWSVWMLVTETCQSLSPKPEVILPPQSVSFEKARLMQMCVSECVYVCICVRICSH